MTKIKLYRNTNTSEIILANEMTEQLNVQGYDPSDLLAGALAKCTESTVANYAKKHNFNVDNIIVRVDFGRDKETKSSSFVVHLDIDGNLSDGELKKLHKSAEKSFVRRVLSQPITVNGHVHHNGNKKVLN